LSIAVSLTNADRLGRPAAVAFVKSTWAPEKLAVDGKAVFHKWNRKRFVISNAVLKRALHFQDHTVSL